MQILLIVTSVFSGVQPHLNAVAGLPVVGWAWFLSLGTYGGQGAMATWAQYQRGQRDMGLGAAAFGYDIADPAVSVGELVALGTLWRGVALGVLLLSLRPQHK